VPFSLPTQRPHFSPERPLFYIHIPKVGGSSLEVLLENQFPAGAIERLEHHPDRRDAQLGRRFTERSCYYGHVPHGFRDLLPPGNIAFAFFRDPIDRALSVFYYWKAFGKENLLREKVPAELVRCCELSLADFIQQVPLAPRMLANGQTRQMGGGLRPLSGGGAMIDPRAMLQQAIRNLDGLAFVGLTERMDESVAALCRAFAWPAPPAAPHVNRTSSRAKAAELDPRTRATLAEWNALDIELYRHAVARYEAQLQALPTWPSVPAPPSVEVTGKGPCVGWGWYPREYGRRGWYRWTMQRAGVELRLMGGGDLVLTLDVLAAMDQSQLTGLTVLLNDRPLPVGPSRGFFGGARFTGSLSDVPDGEATYRVEIQVPHTIRPCDRDPNNPDARPLGVAVSRLSLSCRQAGLFGRLWKAA
jgi:hypothetical protein